MYDRIGVPARSRLHSRGIQKSDLIGRVAKTRRDQFEYTACAL